MSSKTKFSPAQRLVTSAMLIAIATVLSILKIVDLPYGGSVTLGSMFPLVLIAYRYGTGWGILSSLVYGAIQMALGADNFSYVSGALSVIMLALFDYIIAFGLIGLAGLARNEKNSQSFALVLGEQAAVTIAEETEIVVKCILVAVAPSITNKGRHKK